MHACVDTFLRGGSLPLYEPLTVVLSGNIMGALMEGIIYDEQCLSSSLMQ